ncbi:hypothetical protein ABTI09_20425, partial [Acinetobacter baumannii]
KPRDICNDADPRHINQGTFQSALSASGSYSGIGVAANGDYSPNTVAAGTYNLQFKAVNSAGCKDSASQPITVWPSPVAK